MSYAISPNPETKRGMAFWMGIASLISSGVFALAAMIAVAVNLSQTVVMIFGGLASSAFSGFTMALGIVGEREKRS